MIYNQVFEGCFYKGHSNYLNMNGLMLRLRLVDMGTDCILHLIHVEGTRMKRVVIDGLYRGDMLEGMIIGQNPLDFIPLNESADKRSGGGGVVSWINSWWKDRTGSAWVRRALKRFSHDYWFQLHTQDRPRLWTPLPEAMETVVEVLN